MKEDFSGYPPGTTFSVPTGFVALRGNVLNNETQEFNYDLWTTNGIVRWAIRRLTSISYQRRLVYVGTGGVDPSQWKDYTAYTSFEIPVNPASCKVHLHARLQGDSTTEQGYSAFYNGLATGDLIPYRLALRKNDFYSNVTNLDDPNLIAYSTNAFTISNNAIYTLKFTVSSNILSAWFYEGTNLSDPNALKLFVTGTDAEYSTGTAGFGLRVPNTNTYGFFYHLTVEGPLPRGAVIKIK